MSEPRSFWGAHVAQTVLSHPYLSDVYSDEFRISSIVISFTLLSLEHYVRYAFTVYQIISSVTTRTCLVVRTLRLIDTSSTSGTGRGGKAIVWITIKSVQKISIEARTARRRIHSVLKRHTRTTLSVLSSFTAMLKAYVARQIMTSVAAQTVRI